MVKMEFDTLRPEEVCKVCFGALLEAYKLKAANQTNGDNRVVKELFYKELTVGQQALFSYFIYHEHAIQSFVEFCWWNVYFFAQAPVWSSIKSGVQFFGDDAMLQFLDRTEAVLMSNHYPRSLDAFHITREDINGDRELLASLAPLHDEFHTLAPAAVQTIGNAIRADHRGFIRLDDE